MRNLYSSLLFIAFTLILSNVIYSQCGVCTLTNPAVLPSPIPTGTIVCITSNMTYPGATVLSGGEIHVCSGANLTLLGAVAISATSRITMTGCSKVRISGSVFNFNPVGIEVLDGCNCDSAFMYSGMLFGFPIICSPLPVQLVSFDASTEEDNVKISWVTASEINNSYFIIERSIDMINWDEIFRVEGAGNSNEQINYSITDLHLSSGTYYYRLKQIDYDGNSETFDVLSIAIGNQNSDLPIAIYPNPASDVINVRLPNSSGGNGFNIEILSLSGQVIMSRVVYSDHFAQQNFDISGLNNGIFTVRVSSNELIQSTKLIVSK